MILQAQKPSTTDEERAVLQEELQTLDAERVVLEEEVLEAKREDFRKISEDLADGMVERLDEVRAEVARQAEERGLELVYDISGKSSTQVAVLIYAKETEDITAAVINALNADAPEGDTEAVDSADIPAPTATE